MPKPVSSSSQPAQFPRSEEFEPATPIIAREYTPDQLAAPPRRVSRYEERARARARGERGPGCRFISCRTIGCGVLLLLCGLIALTTYVVLARPPFVMNPLKQWLNQDLAAQEPVTGDTVAVISELNSKVQKFKIGKNDLVVTERELRILIGEKLRAATGRDVYVDIDQDKIRVYWDIDANTNVPLWLAIDLRAADTSKIVLDRIGTARVPAPDFLKQALSRLALSALQRDNTKTNGDDILSLIFPLPENVSITQVQMREDALVLTFNVQTGLNGIFD